MRTGRFAKHYDGLTSRRQHLALALALSVPLSHRALFDELRSFHGLFPGGSTKTYPRIFSRWVVQIPGSRSLGSLESF